MAMPCSRSSAGSDPMDAAVPTRPEDGAVRIGAVELAWTTAARDERPTELSRDDVARAADLTPGRRQRFLAGRRLLRTMLTDRFPEARDWWITTAACPHCGGRHGGVAVHGLPALVAVAHADELTVGAVAFVADLARLGVDAEPADADPAREADLARLLGVPAGMALRRWTQVEAVLKADGRGLRVDPAAVRVERGRASLDGVGYRLAAVPGPPGHLISLAWAASAGPSAPARR